MEENSTSYREWRPYTTDFSPRNGERSLEFYLAAAGMKPEDFKNKFVVDVGSGPNDDFKFELKQAEPSARVLSINPDYIHIDSTKSMTLESVEKNWKQNFNPQSSDEYDNDSSVAAIGQELPLRPNTVDYIFAVGSVSNYAKEDTQIEAWSKEFYSALKKGGKAIIVHVYAKDNLVETDEGLDTSQYENDLKNFCQILEKTGFKVNLVQRVFPETIKEKTPMIIEAIKE